MERCFGCMNLKQSHPVCEHCGYDERTQNKSHQLPAGTVLHGQYQVGKVLGQGGFGITYLGWDQTLQMPVAIKELFPMGMVSRDCRYSCQVTNTDGGKWKEQVQDIRNRFLMEARVLAQLSNVGEIVNIRYFFEENNTAYIIMEYLQGTDLRRYVMQQGGKLSAQETMTIMKPVIRALSVVHEHSLIHRDISPDNIMLMDDGRIKILDFGAAKSVNNPDQNSPLSRSTQTILKHGFAPIEQYQSRGSLGPWTDVHALCGTIYFCLTGEVPPDAPRRIVEGIHLDWNQFPDLTDRQRSVLGTGMAIRVQERTGSMDDLYSGLYRSERQTVIPVPNWDTTCPVCLQKIRQGTVCGCCGHDTRISNKVWQLPVGTFLSRRYGVGRVLAEGTCDITYAGWDVNRSRPVAIREFFIQGMVDRDNQWNLRLMDVEPGWREYVQKAYENFLTSSRNLTTIGIGEYFPDVYEVLNEKGTSYQIMEYIPGKTLARYVRDQGGRLSVSKALSLMEPVIRGMGNAHRGGEIHRDLNPNNIKVTDDGKARVMDFSIVPDLRNPWEIRQGLKQQPNPFHPYELYTSHYPLNAATDVYAVCAILYWCMTGQLPPDGPRRVREHIDPWWWQISGLTERQRKTLERGMSVTQEGRIATMEELYNGLYVSSQQPYPTSAMEQIIYCPVCGQIRKEYPQCEHCGYDEQKKNKDWHLPAGTMLMQCYRIGNTAFDHGHQIGYWGWDVQQSRRVMIKECFPIELVNRVSANSLMVAGKDAACSRRFMEVRAQFLQEADSMLKWSDIPRVQNIYSKFEKNGTAYIVLEPLLHGETLDRYVHNNGGKLTAHKTLELFESLIKTFAMVSERRQFVHASICPNRIFVQKYDTLRLINFGNERVGSDAPLIQNGYTPVEAYYSFQNLKPSTDIYAICATMYFCMTGKRPPSPDKRIMAMQQIEWDSIQGLTKKQIKTLEKGMAIRVQARITNMQELYNGLYLNT